MPVLTLDTDHTLTWRDTPWDARAFLMPTREIQALHARTPAGGQELLRQFEQQVRTDGVGLVFTRQSANDALLKRLLGDEGFQHVETSFTISHKQIQRSDWTRICRPLSGLTAASEQDDAGLRHLLATAFDHGRFHEDPWLEPGRAQERYARWLDDLRHNEMQVWRRDQQVQGLHIQSVSGTTAELILTGVARPFSMMALPLWVAALTQLQARGVVECHTLVSAANVGVLNLYARLGFHIDEALFGYHKHFARP